MQVAFNAALRRKLVFRERYISLEYPLPLHTIEMIIPPVKIVKPDLYSAYWHFILFTQDFQALTILPIIELHVNITVNGEGPASMTTLTFDLIN